MKQLIVMRHGEAETNAASDRERALTAIGIDKARKKVEQAALHLPSVSLCMVSPYLRAQETARIVNSKIAIGSFEDSDLITPEADCQAAANELSGKFEQYDNIFLVSHMPFVAGLVNLLAGDREEPVFGFVPAEIIALEFEIFGEGLGSIKRLA